MLKMMLKSDFVGQTYFWSYKQKLDLLDVLKTVMTLWVLIFLGMHFLQKRKKQKLNIILTFCVIRKTTTTVFKKKELLNHSLYIWTVTLETLNPFESICGHRLSSWFHSVKSKYLSTCELRLGRL